MYNNIAGARIPALQLTHTRINNTCLLNMRICLECSFVRYAYSYDTRIRMFYGFVIPGNWDRPNRTSSQEIRQPKVSTLFQCKAIDVFVHSMIII